MITMVSDSLALTGQAGRKIAEFIGDVHYKDSTVTMDADRGTYYLSAERWEARGRVHTVNTRTGSTLDGPTLDYYRIAPSVRDTTELYAIGRPRLTYAVQDSTGAQAEPYLIVGDRIRMKGNDRIWSGGKVMVDRSDFQARGDSMTLDSGPAGTGTLIGSPVLRGLGKDSFNLVGRRIDLGLDRQELRMVTALDDAHATSRQLDLVADTISLQLARRQLEQTLAWGTATRPHALASDYEIRGDSVAFDTPEQLLREIRVYRRAWLAGRVDPGTADRDWMTGDTVVAQFAKWDSAGTTRSAIDVIRSRGHAHSFYRVNDARFPGKPSVNYVRGDSIRVQMHRAPTRGVLQVDIHGAVDGVYLEPVALRPDSAAARDSVRRKPAR
jgi:hypothetical protein